MPLDELTTNLADALFSQRRREIYEQEESDLENIRRESTRSGMVLAPTYVIAVGKYLVKRASKLADAKIESLLTALKKAGLPFDAVAWGEVTSTVIDFCDKQQHRETAFLANHTSQPSLINVPPQLKAEVMIQIQTGISGVMEAVKDKLNATRYETMIDERKTQSVYASALRKQWDVFISHASEDKAGFVEHLAKALEASGLRVWYDKTALSVGDRLRSKIDEGLAHSRYGIVVLSHHFFVKQWPKEELEGLFAREINGAPGLKVILPVWHSITAPEVAQYSPMLAGRLAVNSNAGLDVVVRQLLDAMGIPSNESLASSPTKQPVGVQLSEEARQLLLGASQDRDGRIMWLSMAEGLQIQTNGKVFVEQNPRSEAKWKAAVRELTQRKFIERDGDSIFVVTDEGFTVADSLE